ncbi:hypothetical protein LMG19083_03419 [Ralstonia psammae]|uniref:Uncharacterized protein n=1 Tax=Ralstonia psammae TaxID=3058598 RepID=A0ABN9J5H3_9RALS|nr:hypothetical protein [Ralstonia sp. LMG 19083]CAJ0800272.1 hypothetical protein LMG19083_03419 [Ralstonia sp. LMG 19083]
MANNRRTLIASASTALLLAWSSLVLAAGPSTNAERDNDRTEKKAPPPAATAVPQSNADFDAQIAHLRALRERMARANTPEERQALMNERMRVMQDMMTGIRQMGGMKPTRRNGQANQMALCRGMTERHTAMMEEMMQMLMDGQGMGMGPGMGSGMGSGMGGMMRK